MIEVSIVEDDHKTRESLVKLIRHSTEIICVGAYESAEEAEREIPLHVPDVVLMDINLTGRSGIQCVAKLKSAYPKIEFLILTTYDLSKTIFDALHAGASGYLLKRAAPDELLEAIQNVHAGGSPMSLQIARKVTTFFQTPPGQPREIKEKLSNREQEILGLLSKGMAYKQIAEQLCISPGTVHRHLHAIYGKLHVQTGKEAVVKYLGT